MICRFPGVRSKSLRGKITKITPESHSVELHYPLFIIKPDPGVQRISSHNAQNPTITMPNSKRPILFGLYLFKEAFFEIILQQLCDPILLRKSTLHELQSSSWQTFWEGIEKKNGEKQKPVKKPKDF